VVMSVFGCPVLGGGQQLRSAAVVQCAARPGRAAGRLLAVMNLPGLYACDWGQTALSSVPCYHLCWLLRFMNGAGYVRLRSRGRCARNMIIYANWLMK
jgi:hypothetical protein